MRAERFGNLEVPKRRFGGGFIEVNPRRGLSKGGPYASPARIKEEATLVIPLIVKSSVYEEPQNFKEKAMEFLDKLCEEFRKYFRMSVENAKEEPYEVLITNPYKPAELQRLSAELRRIKNELRDRYGDALEQRAVVLIFARQSLKYQKLSPYYVSKCVLGHEIASQVVTDVALSNFDMSLANVSLGVFAKLGGIPWVLNNFLPVDVVVGVGKTIIKYREEGRGEVSQDYLGSVAIVGANGVISEVRAKVASTKEELASWIGSNVQRAVSEFVLSSGTEEVSLSIHYSGKKPSKDELDGLKEVIEDLKNKKIKVSYKVLHITDDVNASLLCKGCNYYPASGLYYLLSDKEAYLTPLGALKLGSSGPYYSFTGIPRTLKVSLVDASEGNEGGASRLTEGLREVYYLTFMHIAGMQININEPITTKYSRDVARLVGSVVCVRKKLGVECSISLGDVYERPWFL